VSSAVTSRAAAAASGSTRGASNCDASLPIRRVVGPEDVAALAIDLTTNTAVTGATFDIDDGQQLLEG
jgi:enoyl-[acyl-carrier-protein] reductase (NADH)